MKTGDSVQLKEPQQGRRFVGKIIKIHNGLIRVGLSNGLYAEFPEKMWELIDETVEERNVDDENGNEE